MTDGVGAMDVAGERGCCNDAETAKKTGQLCKTGQTCSSSSSGLLPSLHLLLVPFAPVVPPTVALAIPTFYPLDLWRPPILS